MRISDWSSDVCSSDLRGWLRIDVYQGRGKWPANIACLGHDSIAPRRPVSQPNKSFKPNLLRYTSNMAGKACHVAGSATQVRSEERRVGKGSIRRWSTRWAADQ